MAFIKFIFIAILVLWIIRMLIRLILPMLFNNLASKMQQQASGQGQQQQQRRSKPEGAISIDYMPPKPDQSKTDKLGDFVDYEEVK
ncbi:DUF4834 family protein [Pedobacter sp. MC2016-05]|uniref:DUF4834 family protein n=1 Tax=unclassified Pedobacter TaxID=2628915 RepID=UPI000703B27C|nr:MULTISPECIES: DUF4834 family protein [unclassified Pedobacter]KQN34672.1 hypothetical protein ASE92_13895 [Pedobacter sp. Leaf41]MCX2473157.1 DUF4834 family protein [Pedobacter sp. MC2016-05]RZK67040.1 MAG: DUF4834 family protein [Pedobacter sp.]